ncbi:hypothetical protein BDN67DRAFT_965818, partial [Paxillus ammoniavirescens]
MFSVQLLLRGPWLEWRYVCLELSRMHHRTFITLEHVPIGAQSANHRDHWQAMMEPYWHILTYPDPDTTLTSNLLVPARPRLPNRDILEHWCGRFNGVVQKCVLDEENQVGGGRARILKTSAWDDLA